MTPGEVEVVRTAFAELSERALRAERELQQIRVERDQLRALLTRIRTSLAETTGLNGEQPCT